MKGIDELQRKEDFINWLDKITKLSSSTRDKYAGSINTISRELKGCNILNSILYYIIDPIIIKSYKIKYLSIEEFQAKDIRGNRMYSNALKHYKKYVESIS